MSVKITSKEIELFVISKVREIRESKGVSQEALADYMGVTPGYIGQIESPRYRAKYNLAHLNVIARFFECSPRDFLPEAPL